MIAFTCGDHGAQDCHPENKHTKKGLSPQKTTIEKIPHDDLQERHGQHSQQREDQRRVLELLQAAGNA